MRNFINIMESVFYSGPFKASYANGGGEVNITILKNPSPREMDRLLSKSQHGELRGLLDNDLYVWDAELATHTEVARAISKDGSDLHITKQNVFVNDCPDDWTDEEATQTGEWIKQNACLKAFYGGDFPLTLTAPDTGEEWTF